MKEDPYKWFPFKQYHRVRYYCRDIFIRLFLLYWHHRPYFCLRRRCCDKYKKPDFHFLFECSVHLTANNVHYIIISLYLLRTANIRIRKPIVLSYPPFLWLNVTSGVLHTKCRNKSTISETSKPHTYSNSSKKNLRKKRSNNLCVNRNRTELYIEQNGPDCG